MTDIPETEWLHTGHRLTAADASGAVDEDWFFAVEGGVYCIKVRISDGVVKGVGEGAAAKLAL